MVVLMRLYFALYAVCNGHVCVWLRAISCAIRINERLKFNASSFGLLLCCSALILRYSWCTASCYSLAALKLIQCIASEHARFCDRLTAHHLCQIRLVSQSVSAGSESTDILLQLAVASIDDGPDCAKTVITRNSKA